MEKYMNPSLEASERAKDLLSKLSLEEKMAQINCLFPWNKEAESYRKECPYGIGEVSTLYLREVTSLSEAAEWQTAYQKMIMEQSPHHIPGIFHMEGLCGAFIQDAVSFPSGIGRGSSFDPELEERIGAVVSRQELACGITRVLAPVLDISRDSRMGRQGETYGEDPTLAASLGTAYVKGVQNGETAGRHAESEAKHFLGFHNSLAAIHGANVEIGERLFEEVYGKPFQAAIKEADLRGVMPCYCAINGVPVSSSYEYLTGLLRDDMGFDGVVGADYSAISNVYHAQHVGESITDVGMLCLSAGLDVEQPSCAGYNDELKARFASGEADPDILDTAVLRVLTAKFRMGLFEHPFALTGPELRQTFTKAEDREVTLQSALESMVLLKNNGVLPIKKGIRKIALIGTQADHARIFFGGYTHLSMEEAVHAVANSIAGIDAEENVKHSEKAKTVKKVPGTQIQSDETEEFEEILKLQKPECKSLREQLTADLPDTEIAYSYGYAIAGDDCSHFSEALQVCRDADLILMTLGGKHGSCSVASMGEGVDGTDINLPVCQDRFIEEAAKLGIPMVGIHFNGRPISSDIADEYLDAMIEAWNPSEMGAPALSMVLRGAYIPSGKMPVTTARTAGQLPIFYNHLYGSSWHQGESIGFPDYVDLSHRPRYYFGHGLSYTEFAYSDLQIQKKELNPEDTLTVSMNIRNTGTCEGTEVVQLYLFDVQASCSRPVQELAGFRRVHLNPGEEKKVTFRLAVSQLAFLDRRMQWKIEQGAVRVMVGSSSEDIRLQDEFVITEDRIIRGRDRGFYAESSEE